MDFGGVFGQYSLAETTDLTEACQIPCKYVRDDVSALIPFQLYLFCAVVGGVFVGINAIFVLSLVRRFIRGVDAVLESFATMIETVSKGLENSPDEEGNISAEEQLDGMAHHPLAIAKAFVYLVDQILERLMMMGNMMIENGNSTVMEISAVESRLEVAIRELLMEWEEEDKNRADNDKRKEEAQEDRKTGEGRKVRNEKKLVAAGMGGSRAGGVGRGCPKDLVTIS